MIITAMIKNFYSYFVVIVYEKFEGINPTTQLKRFVFRFITVAGKLVISSSAMGAEIVYKTILWKVNTLKLPK